MWSYYGSKSKIVNLYPPPKYSKIIEPFAGSARYSLKYFDRNILLVDKYDLVVNAWLYLKNATEKDILGLPDVSNGDNLKDFNITDTERFIIYCCATGGGAGRTGWQIRSEGGNFNSWNKDKKRIANNLFKIRHWEIKLGDYENIPNEEATWFIDPPYKFGGHKYKHSNKNIDFSKLSEWCTSRKGQAIVCENTKADWLDFKPMKDMQGIMFKTTEVIWSNHITNYDNKQLSLL